MNQILLERVNEFVNSNIQIFHHARLHSIESLSLDKLLKKNPYLLKAKNIQTAEYFINNLLDAFLSSSEEKLFGDFLENLAVFVAEMTCGGHKSTAPGVDLEFSNNDIYYIVSVKSGPNWGNSSQIRRLEQDLQSATTRYKQLNRTSNIQPVLGICYGKTRTTFPRGYMKVVGQNFWYLISENPSLYTEIIEPIGYKAKQHVDHFSLEKSNLVNRFTKEFFERFCEASGQINWVKLVEHNSGNLDIISRKH